VRRGTPHAIVGEPVGDDVEDRLLRIRHQDLVDRGLRSEVLASGETAERRTGPGPQCEEPREGPSQVLGIDRSAWSTTEKLFESPLQEGTLLPERSAALEGEDVHGHRPPLVHLAQGPVERDQDFVEEDLAELLDAVEGLEWPNRDARTVHVDEQRRYPSVNRL
jgi:hypothetical protein